MSCVTINSFGQLPKEGKYQSSDGVANFSLSILENGDLQMVEPNKTSIYNKAGDFYQAAEEKYSNYMMRVESPAVIYAFKKGGNIETKYSWVGPEIMSEENCDLAEKYQNLADDENDPEVQAYTFCAIAALAKCNYTPEGYANYAKGIALVLKQILVNPEKCPCTDVISSSIWNAD